MESLEKLYAYPIIRYQEKLEKITLNSSEEKILNFFLKNNPSNDLTFRIAGGWVRDKLIGKNSEDIDITLDKITGQEYLSKLSENKDKLKEEFNFQIIKNSNDKSQHLQTATIQIYDKQIDLVNLRKEVYEIGSRVPEVSRGSPEEDSLRRDITINCLYYNINTKEVEDFTKKGIDDLRNGIIRMPKDPFISFMEDPLRVLRVIRFTTRFQFQLDEEIKKCFEKEENKEKIIKNFDEILSGERIEKELNGMLHEKYAHCSIYLLYKFGILKSVIRLKDKEDKNNDELFVKCVNSMLIKFYLTDVAKIFGEEFSAEENKEEIKKVNLALMLSQFRSKTIKIKKEQTNESKYILSQVYKLPTTEINEIMMYIDSINKIHELIKVNNDYNRLDVGSTLRNIKTKRIDILILLGLCDKIVNMNGDYSKNIIENIDPNNKEIESIIRLYKSLYEFIMKEELCNIFEMKPILDGKALKDKLGVKPGKQLGELLSFLIVEQIKNPKIKEEEALELLKIKIKK